MRTGLPIANEAWLEAMTRGAVLVSADRNGTWVLRLRHGRLVRLSRLPAWRAFLETLISRALLPFFCRSGMGPRPTLRVGSIAIRFIGRQSARAHALPQGDCASNAAGF